MKFEAEIIKEIVDGRGHTKTSIHYQSECVEEWVKEVEGAYPKLCDYQSEWLNYSNENTGIFPYVTLTDVTNATVENVVPYAYKRAILKGSTKYRDIDTGDILDTFDETKNLELVSVKVPVLTTSNEDGTKTNILTVNEEIELRGIGDVRDTLDCLTGEVTERIGEVVLDGSERWSEWRVSETSYGFALRYYKIDFKPLTIPICDILPSINYVDAQSQTVDKGIALYTAGSESSYSFFIRLPKTECTGLEDFKTKIQQNPITVQYQLATEPIKTVDLSVVDQDGNEREQIKPIEGTMHLNTSGETIKPLFSGEIPVEAITQNLASFIEE